MGPRSTTTSLPGAEQPRPNQCRPKRTPQTWAKQNRANKIIPAQIYQDYLASTVRTPTLQQRQTLPDRRDQEQPISTDGPEHTKPYQANQIEQSRQDHRSSNWTDHNRPSRSSHHVSTHESKRFEMRNQSIDKHVKDHDKQRTIPPQIISKRMEATKRYLTPPPPKRQSKHFKHIESEH